MKVYRFHSPGAVCHQIAAECDVGRDGAGFEVFKRASDVAADAKHFRTIAGNLVFEAVRTLKLS